MKKIGELFQMADWKNEKHVPVIEVPDRPRADEVFQVTVSVGKEIAHPNTTAHHIRWIQLFFLADGEKFPYQVGSFEFTAHGATANGPDTGPVYTHHSATVALKVNKPGRLIATSLCNIHGLWENSLPLELS
jgi:superoxide reductase